MLTPIPNDDAAVHRWLCHPNGDECDGGASCAPLPERLKVYREQPDTHECMTEKQAERGGR